MVPTGQDASTATASTAASPDPDDDAADQRATNDPAATPDDAAAVTPQRLDDGGSGDDPASSSPSAATSDAAFVPTARPAPPVSVSLPSIGVTSASVVPSGLDERGAVAIPDDVRQLGWYDRGPRPGEAGNAFMTSHIDSRTQGRGVLFDLRRSQPGDPITVTHADGSTSDWVVVARERIDKGAYPMDRVFRFDGSPGLVIDTCGGDFDTSTGSYTNIDIVYAEPAV